MGEQKIVDKTIRPQTAPTLVQLTPDVVTNRDSRGLGVLPIGRYKNQASFFDLDKLVNQPLVLVEKAYALDKLDDRNVISVKLLAAAVIGGSSRAKLTVAAGQVLYLNRLVAAAPAADAGGAFLTVNIRVSIWPDIAATPDPDGKAYWSTDKAPKGTPVTIDLPAQGELGEELRLPAGSVITLVATVAGAALAADTTATLTPYGRVANALVE